MKFRLAILFILFEILNISAQEIGNNINFKNKYYSFQVESNKEESKVYLNRIADSLKINMKITPNINQILDSFLFKNGNKSIFLTMSKDSIGNYKLEQFDFVHLDGRKTSLTKFSDDVFNLNIEKYKLDILQCENCKKTNTFIIYKSSW